MLREKNYKQKISQVKVEEGEEISYKKADAAMRRSIDFWGALQSPHGHWPAENAGVMFYIPPLVPTNYSSRTYYLIHVYKYSASWKRD